MNENFAIKDQLIELGSGLLDAVVTWTPRLLMWLVIIVIVLVAAKIVERVVRKMLVKVRLDQLLEKFGFASVLQRLGLTQPASHVVARLIYWLFLFVFVQSAANALGIEPISNGIGAFIAYFPNLLAAVLILMIGSAAGQFAGQAAGNAAKNSGIEFASALGSVVSALILVIAGVMAVGQLKLDTDIIRIVTACVLASLALAFGLSFGLGTREITRNIIAGFYARKVFKMGVPIEIRGQRGNLTAITPTQTLLDKDGETIAISNSAFLEEVVRQ